MEQNVTREEIEIDIKEIIGILMSKIWFIALLGVIVGIIAFVYSKYVIAPVYSSTTKVYVLNRQSAEANVTYTDLQTGTQLTKDYIELVKSRTVLTQVIDELDLNISAGTLADMIEVSAATDGRIITITVNSTDVYEAQKIADSLRSISSVHICSVMNLEAVNVIDEADLPTAPSSPNVKRNAVFGVLIGIILAMAIVVLRHLMNDSILTPDDVERYLELSVLASIPILEDESKRKKKRRKPEMSLEDEDMYREEPNNGSYKSDTIRTLKRRIEPAEQVDKDKEPFGGTLQEYEDDYMEGSYESSDNQKDG